MVFSELGIMLNVLSFINEKEPKNEHSCILEHCCVFFNVKI